MKRMVKVVCHPFSTHGFSYTYCRERNGSVVECLTRGRGAAGLSLTGVTVLQHAHSYFCLGVHVPPGVSIWGYMFIFEGTHILELFFHRKRIEAMKSDHLDVYNSDIIML